MDDVAISSRAIQKYGKITSKNQDTRQPRGLGKGLPTNGHSSFQDMQQGRCDSSPTPVEGEDEEDEKMISSSQEDKDKEREEERCPPTHTHIHREWSPKSSDRKIYAGAKNLQKASSYDKKREI